MPDAGLEKPFLALGKVIETINRQLPAAEYFGKTSGFFFAAGEKVGRRVETPAGERTMVLVQGVQLGDLSGFQQRQGFDPAIGQIPEGGRKSPMKAPPAGDRAEAISRRLQDIADEPAITIDSIGIVPGPQGPEIRALNPPSTLPGLR